MAARGGHPPMSPWSAALPLLAWIETHGRWPTQRECCPAQGLLHASTYYRYFQTWSWSAVVAQAQQVVTVSNVAPPAPAQKPCLGCAVSIVDEGHHIRYCARCRRQLTARADHYDAALAEPSLSLVALRRYGKGRAGWDDTDELMEGSE